MVQLALHITAFHFGFAQLFVLLDGAPVRAGARRRDLHLAEGNVLVVVYLVEVLAIIVVLACEFPLVHFGGLALGLRLRGRVVARVVVHGTVAAHVNVLMNDESVALFRYLVLNFLELPEEFEEVALNLLLVDILEVLVILHIDHFMWLYQLHRRYARDRQHFLVVILLVV